MGNWDRHIGDHYLHRTLYDTGVFADALNESPASMEPPPFKIYRGVPRYNLCHNVPLALGDTACSFDECTHPSEGHRDEVNARLLSTFLYYAYGFSRHDEGPGAVWPQHRFVASARCLFPTELYVWVPESDTIPAGLYHYDNLHHALQLLRRGDCRAEMSAAVGARLDTAQCVLLVSSLFWKNAFKYHSYAYRLCTQEAGMVTGNVLLVGRSLGFTGHVHYQFVDQHIGALVGLDNSAAHEHVFAVVPMYSTLHGQSPGSTQPHAKAPDQRQGVLPSIAATFIGQRDFEHDLGELFTGIADNSMLTEVSEFRTEPANRRSQQCVDNLLTPPDDSSCVESDLADTLRARNSGNVLFNPVSKPLKLLNFWTIVRHSLRSYGCDLRDTESAPAMELYIAVINVTDMPTGLYRFCPGHGGLHTIDMGDFSRELQGAMVGGNVNLCSSSLVLYVAASYAAASETFGNRAYRIVNMEGGVIAHRVGTLSAAYGLSARIHNGYDSHRIKEVLSMNEDVTPLFQILVAYNRPGVQYELPIVF